MSATVRTLSGRGGTVRRADGHSGDDDSEDVLELHIVGGERKEQLRRRVDDLDKTGFLQLD